MILIRVHLLSQNKILATIYSEVEVFEEPVWGHIFFTDVMGMVFVMISDYLDPNLVVTGDSALIKRVGVED